MNAEEENRQHNKWIERQLQRRLEGVPERGREERKANLWLVMEHEGWEILAVPYNCIGPATKIGELCRLIADLQGWPWESVRDSYEIYVVGPREASRYEEDVRPEKRSEAHKAEWINAWGGMPLVQDCLWVSDHLAGTNLGTTPAKVAALLGLPPDAAIIIEANQVD